MIDAESLAYQDIKDVLEIFNTFSYVCLILLFVTLLIYEILEKKYNIALLKSFGFNDVYIQNILILNFGLIVLLSFSISTLVIKFIDIISQYLLEIKDFFNLNLVLNNFCIILFLLTLVSFSSILVIKKISIIKILKN